MFLLSCILHCSHIIQYTRNVNSNPTQKRKRPGPTAQGTWTNPRPTSLLRLSKKAHNDDQPVQASEQSVLIVDQENFTDMIHREFETLETPDDDEHGLTAITHFVRRRKAYSREFKLQAISRIEQDKISKYALGNICGNHATYITLIFMLTIDCRC